LQANFSEAGKTGRFLSSEGTGRQFLSRVFRLLTPDCSTGAAKGSSSGKARDPSLVFPEESSLLKSHDLARMYRRGKHV
jgi:hypothetical protein